MDEGRVGHALEYLADDGLDTAPVQVGHGVDGHSEPAHQLALAVVQGAHADEEDVLRLHGR